MNMSAGAYKRVKAGPKSVKSRTPPQVKLLVCDRVHVVPLMPTPLLRSEKVAATGAALLF
ncbi:uncharacterized protein PADG_05644 [Paracoccidioides brasiliensis Pb18]|uniref:Uncharacterized protein n=2 Tax=Paracoccidioides brasiliensis TaxID=121759 RepID=C1GEF8_PARBD|nr:uncharacterized protein PADG_05644 [Paracoccidioides brasiliensis Pb18]EEH49565.2 hypothetical protein PADG_05644 [Paracoccidioides brasiliensis Pb18]ODH42856.1 hypothetical protein ACO22_01127 [Paracoccidioides brasiliensis]ODH53155.1 hypothetical protein GX48_00691 [Paracoccidioides brasiliensis]